MKKSAVFTAVAFCTFASLALAQDANPVDPKQVLQELQDIQTKHDTGATTAQKQNIDFVLKGAASREAAIALYEDAQMATQFQGANRENSQLRDWKKRQEDQLKDNDFRESVRLHLFYLALSLKKAADAKPAVLAPQVADYLNVLDNSWGALNAQGSFLRIPVSEGIFAKWLGLGPELEKAKDWEMNPGASEKIAEKYLLPEWRKQKSPALLTYWDGRIARVTSAAGNAKLDFQQKNYALIDKPDLLWQRSQEYFVLDQPNRAIQEMFSLIKAYPNHPDVAQWISTLKKTLQPSPKPTPAPAQPESTPQVSTP